MFLMMRYLGFFLLHPFFPPIDPFISSDCDSFVSYAVYLSCLQTVGLKGDQELELVDVNRRKLESCKNFGHSYAICPVAAHDLF